MPADPLTKIDPSRGNAALHDVLTRGTLCLIDEEGHVDERSLNLSLKSRSRGASKKVLSEHAKVQAVTTEGTKVRFEEVEEEEEGGEASRGGRGEYGGE
eukprot:7456692-Pyramimonas_sp.AAC.1